MYNESLSDFASLIQEHGAQKVAQAFAAAFPEQTIQLVGYLGKPTNQIARLFQAPDGEGVGFASPAN